MHESAQGMHDLTNHALEFVLPFTKHNTADW